MDLTPKQQTSEAIRQAETILILTGQHPSVDQAAAVMALGAILRKFGKKASPVISDSMPQALSLLDGASVDRNLGGLRDFILKIDTSKAEVDKLRYEMIDGKLNVFVTPFKGNFAPSDVTFGYGDYNYDYDLVVILGVPTRARIDRVYDQNAQILANVPVINIDFRRSNENYGAVNLIEPTASSLCEMMVALSESLQSGIIDADIATALLMGIMGSTDRFTATHTTSKSLTVAAQMMAAGARQQAVVRALYRDGRGDQQRGDRGQGSQKDGAKQPSGSQPQQQVRPERQPERPADRPERQPERTSDQRPERSERQMENNAVQQRDVKAVPVPAVEPAVVQPAPAAAPIPEQVMPVAQAPAAPAATGYPVSPDREPDLPIIQPGHIEMSETGSATGVSGQQVPEGVSPMVDFAAAAEMLAQQERDGRKADA